MYLLILFSQTRMVKARVSPEAKLSLSVLVKLDAEKRSINGDGERFL